MNCSRADASTSTEDLKGRPLCLFYFTHPFGVLSPGPPTITTAPPNIARTYVNMEPIPPFWTSSSSPGYDTTSTRPSFDIGNATVHRNPISVVRNYGVDLRRDTVSSSLFSSDIWFSSSGSSRNCERRVIHYHKTLPPIQLPTRDLSINLDSSDDIWPKKYKSRDKYSLPPIELPSVSDIVEDKVSMCDSDSLRKYKRVLGVQKHKRKTKLSSVRRMLTSLIRRNTRGNSILQDLGLPCAFGKPLRYIHGLFGVMMFSVNIILFVAAINENDALCEVYLWHMVIYWTVLLISVLITIWGGISSGALLFALFYSLAVALMLLVSFYFTLVVANYRMTLP